MSNNGWTEARRKRQAELIKQWQPWKHSTRPKTAEGRKNSKQNATKHGARSHTIRLLERLL